MQNDSLVVRASVTVKSSSVSIDLDDAELYLKCAVEEGKPDAVQLCLDQGASVNCQFKDDLYTPLHTACSATPADDNCGSGSDNGDGSNKNGGGGNIQGSMEVMELLLEKGADGNACNKWRETPLLIAANNGHRAAVEALLRHEADPSLCSEAGWSALTFAAHKVRAFIVFLQTQTSLTDECLTMADHSFTIRSAMQGYDDIVALLLDHGAPVNCLVAEDFSTPLHKACAGSKPGHLRAVELLLESEADVHALNKWRETPLLTAANHGQAGAVDALLKAGADPCKCTDTGWSPLSIAAYKGHDDVVKLLLEEGAPTEEADPTLSALLQAATKGLPDTVALLLRHGADHTVTTKKGDTALSILVEQNLIDAAVEMVTEYKASVPRCSRDRKKVQRARLLINLRVKQQQRGDLNLGTDDDDDDDESDMEDSPALAAVIDDNYDDEVARPGKKGTKKKKVSAEQQAKEAEEALLLELEQEDAERNKQEEEANKKSAKKKKKKERERQQKKELEDRRLAEERITEETRQKDLEAKEAVERAERERVAAAKKKEEDEIRGKQQKSTVHQQKEPDPRKTIPKKEDDRKTTHQQSDEQVTKTIQQGHASQTKNTKGAKGTSRTPKNQQQSTRSVTANNSVAGAAGKKVFSKPGIGQAELIPPGKRRGWESLPSVKSGFTAATTVPVGDASHGLLNATLSNDPVSSVPYGSLETNSKSIAPAGNIPNAPQASATSFSVPKLNAEANHAGLSGYGPAGAMSDEISIANKDLPPIYEPPSVSYFRREKVCELLQRCSVARSSSEPLGFVSEMMLKKVLFRWIMRAAHESADFHDFMIPSWVDVEYLVTFFQRQFISETRKEGRDAAHQGPGLSVEALRDAGTAIAHLCNRLAKEVAQFRRHVEEQLPAWWNDSDVGMAASEAVGNSNESIVVIDWARRSQVTFPTFVFSQMRDRYQGLQSRLLSSMFAAKVCYSTKDLLVGDTGMDLSLLPATKSMLSAGMSVTAEIWSDPLHALAGNSFWGIFAEIDTKFGGFKPFGTCDVDEDVLRRNGGSISVLAPPDSMLAARYVHRIIDILEYGEQARVPLSFAIFLRSECLVDPKPSPSVDDFLMLDPRLREQEILISRIGRLPKGKHSYYDGSQRSGYRSMTDSLLVLLQNSAGRGKYALDDATFLAVLQSTDPSNIQTSASSSFGSSLAYSSETSFGNNDPTYIPKESYARNVHPLSASPIPQYHSVPSDFESFGSTTNAAVANPFATDAFSASQRRSAPRRGRLFDLVDDGEEDNAVHDMDVVSGMLGNLDVDLFQNSGVHDVDIEAISLMGIGGSSGPSNGLHSRRTHGRFG